MNDLRRELAPLSDAAWEDVSEEATRTLKTYLAARKLVDFSGPHGWTHSAVNSGRADRLEERPADGVEARRRMVQPLVELRAPFDLDREELDAVGRGAADPDLQPVVDAARAIARAEDRLVFYGFAGAGGICPGSPHRSLHHSGNFEDFPGLVTQALELLRDAGVSGPYGIALSPDLYNGLAGTVTAGRHSMLHFVERLLGGPVVWAPSIDDGVVVSLRGGDFELTVGRDVSLGYLDHDLERVRLYLEESAAFRVLTPEAAVRLAPGPV